MGFWLVAQVVSRSLPPQSAFIDRRRHAWLFALIGGAASGEGDNYCDASAPRAITQQEYRLGESRTVHTTGQFVTT